MLSFDPNSWEQDFAAAANLGADQSFTVPRAEYTVATNAVQSAQPIVSDPSMGQWGQFFRDLTKTVVGYSIAKDAAQSGLVNANGRPVAPVYTQPAQPAGLGGLLPLVLVGVIVYAVAKN